MSNKYFPIFALFLIFMCLVRALQLNFNQKDNEIFIKLLNDIPTWESEKINFSEYELEQLSLYNTNALLSDKYKKKLISLRCIYGYAIKHILWDLHSVVTSSQEKLKQVKFSKKSELLFLNGEYDIDISEVLKKEKFDLTDESRGTFTNDIKEITELMSPNQIYIINTMKESEEDYTFLNLNHEHLKVYVDAIGRMISVMIMSQSTVSNWMWMIYLYLNSIDKNKINQKKIQNYFRYADKMIDKCSKDNYLENLKLSDIKVFDIDEKYKNKNDISSISLLKKLKLISESKKNFLQLFKYENMLGIYDAFWTKKANTLNILPGIESFNWNFLRRDLDYINKNFETMWNNVPFSIVNYYKIISDAMKIVLLYSWYLITTKKAKKSRIIDVINFDWVLECPLEEIQSIIKFFNINYENLYSNFTSFFNRKIKVEQNVINKFNDQVLLELQKLLNTYKAFENNKNLKEHLHEKINDLNIDKCSNLLIDYFHYIKQFVEPLDFNVIKAFEMSNNKYWINFN
ncbi:uncharacterized protein LOC126903222 [Daktulosphaira vitifoliae]|uniref:uncharacterized protein LOC126903222 n=1 Tax=Daktulosphaira vitifoliae TaxID=58002 RepID=UPI0021A9F020|nr:uncharacterized protein LOC126903222 [Daktulosphaira vitifoliae]